MNIVKQTSCYHRKRCVPLCQDCGYLQRMVDHRLAIKSLTTAMNFLCDLVGGGQYCFCFGQMSVGCHSLDEVINHHWLLPAFFRYSYQGLCITPSRPPLYSSSVLHLVFFCNI